MISLLRRVAPWLAMTVLSFGIAACGGDDNGESGNAGAARSTGNSGAGSNADSSGADWTGELESGAKVSLDLWVPASDPDLASFEAFRGATGTDRVLHGRAVVLNDTSETETGRFVTLTDDHGDLFSEDLIDVNFLCAVMAHWWNGLHQEDRTSEVIEQYMELANEDCGGASISDAPIPPGGTLTLYVAYEGGSAPAFSRVFMGILNELKK